VRYVVTDPPAPATTRADRWADIEDMILALQELGWRLERCSQIDEPGEPLRAVVRVAWEHTSSLGGLL
jgi:hypothetical protein